jgi:hypothetical protein
LLLVVRCRSATDAAERFSGIGHTGQTYRAYYPVVSIPTRLLTVLVGPQRGCSSRAWGEKQVSMYCTYRASNKQMN